MYFYANIGDIVKNLGLSEEFLEEKIKEKIDQTGGLIDEQTALLLVLKELGVDITDLSRTKLIDILDQNIISNVYVAIEKILIKKESIAVFSVYDDTAKARLILKNTALDVVEELEKQKIIHIKKAVVLYNNTVVLYVNNKDLIDFEVPEKLKNKLKNIDFRKLQELKIMIGKILNVDNNSVVLLSKNLKILKFQNAKEDIENLTYKLRILDNSISYARSINMGDVYKIAKKVL